MEDCNLALANIKDRCGHAELTAIDVIESFKCLEKVCRKQTYREPVFIEICAFNNRNEYECPECRQGLPLYDVYELWHCPSCGQKIDLECIADELLAYDRRQRENSKIK